MAAAPWLGDFSTTAIVVAEFGTYNSSGASITRNVNGTISVFESTSTVSLASTSITDNEDYRGITGAHSIWVDLNISSTLVTIGRDYSILLANSSIDSATVSAPLATFSIRNRSLRPTSTGGVVTATNLDKTNYTVTGSSVVIAGAVWGTTRSAFGSTLTFGDIPSSAAFPTNFPILFVSTTGTVALSSTSRAEAADALLDRDMSLGTDSGSTSVRTVRQALRPLRNKTNFGAAGSTYQVYKENDSDLSWTGIVSLSTDATPITGMDPLGPS